MAGLQQTFPNALTAIQFLGGDWIVVSIRVQWRNLTNYHVKLNDWEIYEQVDLKKFPSDPSKSPGYKAKTLEDETQYRGFNIAGTSNSEVEDDSGSPKVTGDDFNLLYFQQNKKEKGADPKVRRSAEPVYLEFGQIGEAHQDSGIAYYVWPIDDGSPVPPDYLPAPTKDQALGPIPSHYWLWYEPNTIWVAIFNSANSWYETWSPGLRYFLGNLIGFEAFDKLVRPDNIHFGWTKNEDRDAFLAAWNQMAYWSQHGDGAYHDYWPLPNYYPFQIDWSEGPQNPGEKSGATYTINAYRFKYNNITFDDANKLTAKKLPTGKDHASYTVEQGQPADKARVRIDWDSEDGLSITRIS